MNAFDKYNYLKDYILIPILERFNIAEKERNYLVAFYINGIMAIIKEWLNKNCKDNIEDIEDVIIKCVGVYKWYIEIQELLYTKKYRVIFLFMILWYKLQFIKDTWLKVYSNLYNNLEIIKTREVR